MTRSGLSESAVKAANRMGRRRLAGMCLGLAMANPVLALNLLAFRPPPRPTISTALVQSHRIALAAGMNEIRVSAGRSATEYRIQQLGHPVVYARSVADLMRAIERRQLPTANEAIKLVPDFVSAQQATQFKARSALADPAWHEKYFGAIPRVHIDEAIHGMSFQPMKPKAAIMKRDGQWFTEFDVVGEHGERHVLRLTSTMHGYLRDLVNYVQWAYAGLKARAAAGSEPSSESVVNLALTQLATKSGVSMDELKGLVQFQLDDRSIARIDEPDTTAFALAGEDHGAL